MIALRISKEIKDGDYVNLGIGIPTLISNWIEAGISCCRAKSPAENPGRWLPMKRDRPGLHQCQLPADYRNSGHDLFRYPGILHHDPRRPMNLVVMGALQVNDKGDYAGWANPSRGLDVGNIGGSMDW